MRKKVLIAKVIARFPAGKVVVYNVGEYNKKDFDDLLKIARMIACENCVSVYILPRISSRKDPMYKKLFSRLEGTMYYGKCPDLKIVAKDGMKTFVEYESFTRPYSPGNLSDMLRRGSLQSDSIIIDIRESTIKPNHIRRQIMNKLHDPTFDRSITNVWSFNGEVLKQEWGKKL